MLEFFRVSLATTLCYRRNDPLARTNRQKHRNVNLSQCQINERVREERANDKEVYQIRSIRKNNRIKANQVDGEEKLDKICRITPQQQLSQQKLSLPDKSTACFVRVASFGTQTTEEWRFKRVTTIVSKATQTPISTAYNEESNENSESEERLKLQAWEDAKFFVTNQLLAQCIDTSNCTKVWHSTESYASTRS
uniref:Uncharacterized protein n=1 Tax=Elaeophora elaphi TaxID=1147741 RepID=A0A0R3RXR3_9BILA